MLLFEHILKVKLYVSNVVLNLVKLYGVDDGDGDGVRVELTLCRVKMFFSTYSLMRIEVRRHFRLALGIPNEFVSECLNILYVVSPTQQMRRR